MFEWMWRWGQRPSLPLAPELAFVTAQPEPEPEPEPEPYTYDPLAVHDGWPRLVIAFAPVSGGTASMHPEGTPCVQVDSYGCTWRQARNLHSDAARLLASLDADERHARATNPVPIEGGPPDSDAVRAAMRDSGKAGV